MRLRVINHLDDLADDLREIKATCRRDMRDTVLDGIRAGNELAKDYAKQKNDADSHSRLYPGKFSAAMHNDRSLFGNAGLFGNVISGEYGPRPEGQGLLGPILERGSRNGNAPQNNLAKSADAIGAIFPLEVHRLPSRWFW